MSRRFGRNQKRRMREQAATLQTALHYADRAVQNYKTESDQLRKAIDTARYALGDHIALPPRFAGDHPHPLGGSFDREAVRRLSLDEFRSLADSGHQQALRLARMHTLIAQVRKENRHSDLIHLRMKLDNGDVVYCISEDAIARSSSDVLEDLLTNQIAPALARELTRFLKERRSGRR